MTYFKFISVFRVNLPPNLNQSRVFVRNHVGFCNFKDIVSRSDASLIRITNFKTIKIIPICMSQSCSVRYKSIKVYVRQPIKLHGYFRSIHTSEHRFFHPILWVVFRPVLKFMALLTGRAFRKWWKDLPSDKKKYFLSVLKENKNKLAIFIFMCAFLSVSYYVSHIEETPITKRRRFMAFNSKQLEKINQFEFQQLMQKMHKDMLPLNHPSTQRVQAVVDRLLKANWDIKEMKDKKWNVAVINSSEENAFVLPSGFVCVFSGMLTLCSTDDELGVILSHEIAHCIQGHGAENVSLAHLLDLISILIIAAIWAIFPSDSLSLVGHWLYSKAMKLFFELPYNRKIESEADFVGLHLAAKACFDVRESSAFWAKMAILQNSMNNGPAIEFLSTHPSHETRSVYLDSIMDKAMKYRYDCGCPKLKPVDPRLNVEIMAKALDVARQKYLQQFPKPLTPFHL